MTLTNGQLEQALKASTRFQELENGLSLALAYVKISKKAYRRYLETVETLKSYDEAYDRGDIWTLINTKQQVENKAMNYLAAHHKCYVRYNQLLKEII